MDGGKWRIVTVNSVEQHALRPLHSLLYDHLARKSWLLRGDASAPKLSDFCLKSGELFCSGDYEAATDNIPLEAYRVMLDAVAATSSEVPASVWHLARLESRKILVGEGGAWTTQRRGQLMGSYLSFPFLCLFNYLVFRFSVRRRGVPVKINGDDIVFRASPQEIEAWKSGVRRCGWTLSDGKTVVDPVHFTINSALFKGSAFKSRSVPYVRSAALFKRPDSPEGLVGQLGSVFSGAPGHVARRVLQVKFLTRNRNMILRTQPSLTRCLGAKVSEVVLRMSGLYEREMFYLSLPDEKPLPPACPWPLPISSFAERVDLKRLGSVEERRQCRVWAERVFPQALRLAAQISTVFSPVLAKPDWTVGTWRWRRWRKNPVLWSWACRFGRGNRPRLEKFHSREYSWRPVRTKEAKCGGSEWVPAGGGDRYFLNDHLFDHRDGGAPLGGDLRRLEEDDGGVRL